MRRTHPELLALRLASLVGLAFSMATVIEYFGGRGTFCAAGGGCDVVRASGTFGGLLPPLGVLGFTLIFMISLMRGRGAARVSAAVALAAGAAGLYFVYLQAVVIGAFCWLCLVVDASAVVAAGAGLPLLLGRVAPERLGTGLASALWAPYWIASLAPVIFATTVQDPELPDAVRELYDPAAEVNIVEMADFECPYCRAMHPVLREAVARSGAQVHLVRIVVPLSFHEHARDAARAYFCAPEERREAMADALFAAEDLGREGLAECAAGLGLDVEAFRACLDADATEARVREDLDRSERAGMRGLPTVYIGAQVMVGFDPEAGPEVFLPAIAAARRGEGRRIRYWPSVTLALLVGGSLLLGRWSRRRGRRRAPAAGRADAPGGDL